MPPVQHHHRQDVPDLVARAKVVQLSWGQERGRVGQLLDWALTGTVQHSCSSKAKPPPPVAGRQWKVFNRLDHQIT